MGHGFHLVVDEELRCHEQESKSVNCIHQAVDEPRVVTEEHIFQELASLKSSKSFYLKFFLRSVSVVDKRVNGVSDTKWV